MKPFRKKITCLCLALNFILLAFSTTRTEQLPIKNFSSADGLASSAITSIARDSYGYLWFCSRDGLSRYDGFEFINYRLPNLPATQTFRYFLETRDGFLWFSTDDGLYRARRQELTDVKPVEKSPGNNERFLNAQKVADGSFAVLLEDRAGRLWGGSSRLYRLENLAAEKIVLREVETQNTERKVVFDMREAEDGSLWVVYLNGAMRILPDARQIFYPIPRDSAGDEVFALETDQKGRVFFAQNGGVFVFKPEEISDLTNAPDHSVRALALQKAVLENSGEIKLPDEPGRLLQIAPKDERAAEVFDSNLPNSAAATEIFRAADGKIWISFRKTLYVFDDGNYSRIGDSDTLTGTTRSIVEDADKNLWIGTNGGVLKLIRDGLTTYGQKEGLPEPQITSIHENSSGDLIFAHGIWRVSLWRNNVFESTVLNVPPDARFIWSSSVIQHDAENNFWALAREGLYRFPARRNFLETVRQSPQMFLQGKPLYRAFTDKRGDIWFFTRGFEEQNGLVKYVKNTGELQDLTVLPGYPKGKAPASFAEDADGGVWMGFYGADGLVKFRNGEFTEFTPENSRLPRGPILALHIDRKGRLWIGSVLEGLSRVDDPGAQQLEFVRYTTAEGLTSSNIRTIAEDFAGNIYVGTVRGVDRITPETGRIRHFSTADGLAADFVNVAFTDRSGHLWFGTTGGLSRLVPREEISSPNAPVFISKLEIAGETYGISEFGQSEVSNLDLAAAQNNLQIGFSSVGAAVRFQYKLDGERENEWSPPSEQRTVNFANLAPGSYRFLVRAISSSGLQSENSAVVAFRINPPFYQSRGFIAFTVLIIVALIFALDRYRVSKTRQVEQALEALRKSKEERLRELERVRTRIATDLHDDIGSSLTQIAVLSQAAQTRIAAENRQLETPLERISTVSIELVNAMSDIVWAINPHKDNVRDLVQRMRRFASDVFTAKGVKFDFDAPDLESKLQLGANIRREVFAIYKEAVNNAVRHSNCTRAEISLKISGDLLQLQISDNGRGFDFEELLHLSQPPAGTGGNGLANMRKRGAELGGRCEIITFPGGGTTVLFEVPLHFEKTDNPASHAAGENNNGSRLK